MITLKSIKLNDFISHKETYIEFSENDKILLSGDSGCGKSGVIEGILWCLYGEGRSDNRSLVRRGGGVIGGSCELTIQHDLGTVRITRAISPSGKHSLNVTIDGIAHTITGLKELQAWIETELIGMSYLLFVNSIAYVQGNVDSFVSQSAAGRKNLLLEIVKAGNFEKNYEKTKDAIAFYTQEKATAETTEVFTKKALSDATESVKNKCVYEDEIAKIRLYTVDLKSKKGGLSEKLMYYSSLDNEALLQQKVVDGLKREIEALNTKITELEGLEKLLETIDIDKNEKSELEKLVDEKSISLDLLTKEIQEKEISNRERGEFLSKRPSIGTQEDKKKYAERQIKEISETPDCPAQDNCPYMVKKNIQIAAWQKEIDQAVLKFEEETKAFLEWQEKYNKMPSTDSTEMVRKQDGRLILEDTINSSKRKIDILSVKIEREAEFREKTKDLVIIKESLKEKELELLVASDKLKEILSSFDLDNKKKLQRELDEINKEEDKLRQDEVKLSADLSNIEKAEQTILLLEKDIKKIEEQKKETDKKLEKLALLKEVFGSKGLKTVILDFVLPSLEYEINNFLSKMSDFKVRIDTQKQKVDTEEAKEGLFITIINENGEEMSFENYSGGEKVRITIAISEALASLGGKIGFRLVDEAIHSLDSEMTENFATIFKELQDKYPQMLMVSHLPEIKTLFDDVYVAKKKNGITTLIKEKYGE